MRILSHSKTHPLPLKHIEGDNKYDSLSSKHQPVKIIISSTSRRINNGRAVWSKAVTKKRWCSYEKCRGGEAWISYSRSVIATLQYRQPNTEYKVVLYGFDGESLNFPYRWMTSSRPLSPNYFTTVHYELLACGHFASVCTIAEGGTVAQM